MRRYPSELRADLQRYYGINLDDVGETVGALHVAALVACLPLGSSVLSAIDQRNSFTETDWLLLGILNSLRNKPIDPFAIPKARRGRRMDAESMRRFLAMPRREVRDGD